MEFWPNSDLEYQFFQLVQQLDDYANFHPPRADRMKEFFDRTETRTNSPNAFRILQVGEFAQKCSLREGVQKNRFF